MAASKKNTIPTADNTDKVIDGSNGKVDNAATDNSKADYKALQATLKAAGIDSKGMYTEYTNDPEDVKDTLEFLVKKNAKNAKVGITQETMDAALVMFAAMAKANAPKVKVAHVCPVDVASDYAVAWGIRQQMLAQHRAAHAAVDKLYCETLDSTKADLDAAKAAVTAAGFSVNAKNGTIATGKGKTDREHGNAGTSRVQTGCTITVGDTSYNGWKDLAKNLVTSVYKGDTPTNYPVNTKILEALVAMDLPVTVHITPTLVNGTKDAALDAWNKSALCAKLTEYPSIVVNVK
jgi:hypothetical protein